MWDLLQRDNDGKSYCTVFPNWLEGLWEIFYSFFNNFVINVSSSINKFLRGSEEKYLFKGKRLWSLNTLLKLGKELVAWVNHCNCGDLRKVCVFCKFNENSYNQTWLRSRVLRSSRWATISSDSVDLVWKRANPLEPKN